MSLGKPVVASDIAGIREVVTPDAGVLVRPSDPHAFAAALARLVHDEPARREVGKRAREVIRERYELGRTLGEIVRVLEAAVLAR
jgi:glycosyltransferase involved in cell wall biosynthesis